MNSIHFDRLNIDTGEVDHIRVLSYETIKKCPKLIFLPEHYREDGSCRCNEQICETEGCHEKKWDEEIYCITHC